MQPNYQGDISGDHDSSASFQSNHPHDNTSSTISISMEIYRRLIQNSVDLVKANETIKKLNRKISKRDTELQKMKAEKSNSEIHLSAVSK